MLGKHVINPRYDLVTLDFTCQHKNSALSKIMQIKTFSLFFLINLIKSEYCDKASCVEKGVPIHWDLIGLDQDDPFLIQSIKNKVLLPPPKNGRKLKLKQPIGRKLYYGQHGQSFKVDDFLRINGHSIKNGFFIEAQCLKIFQKSLAFCQATVITIVENEAKSRI